MSGNADREKRGGKRMPSFDVVSVVNMQEVDNAVNQAVIQLRS